MILLLYQLSYTARIGGAIREDGGGGKLGTGGWKVNRALGR